MLQETCTIGMSTLGCRPCSAEHVGQTGRCVLKWQKRKGSSRSSKTSSIKETCSTWRSPSSSAAFKAVVDSFVQNVMMQIVAAIAGKPSIDDVIIEIGKGKINIGAFINSVLQFLVVALAVFVAVKAFTAMQKKKDDEPSGPTSEDLLAEIRDELRNRG